MSQPGIVRFLESIAGDYPHGIPLRRQGIKGEQGVVKNQKALFFVADTELLDVNFWNGPLGDGLRRVVSGGFKLSLDEVEFRAGCVDLKLCAACSPQLVVQFGGGDFSLANSKTIAADSLSEILSNIESKRRLWNEIKRVMA